MPELPILPYDYFYVTFVQANPNGEGIINVSLGYYGTFEFDDEGVPISGPIAGVHRVQLGESDGEVVRLSDVLFNAFDGILIEDLEPDWQDNREPWLILDGDISTLGSDLDDNIDFMDQSRNYDVKGYDGDDIINTGYGRDEVFGGAGNDVISASNNGENDLKADKIHGDDGDDIIYGGTQFDAVAEQHSGQWNRYWGDAGEDILHISGKARVFGGDDADVFGVDFSEDSFGHVVIHDFNAAEDEFDFGIGMEGGMDPYAEYSWFLDHAKQQGSNTVVKDGNTKVIIRSTDIDDITIDHFGEIIPG